MDYKVFGVTEVNQYIKTLFDQNGFLSSICVRGEISNYKQYSSGHCYFSLKDSESSIRCVLFRTNAAKLRFRPKDGDKVMAVGRISVFPRDGAYQLYCEFLLADGVGDLHEQFEQLKQKLQKEGLFAEAHKKPLPTFPEKIGLITSDSGAAVHDMIRIIRKRYPVAKMILIPTLVQGTEAPAEIIRAIRTANELHVADVLIVGRGGGSMEDLWAYNDEGVARAIYQSEIPVISAVGHEPDVTIADYVADRRAATPSNGAELATPDAGEIQKHLNEIRRAMTISLQACVKQAKYRLSVFENRDFFKNPLAYIQNKQLFIDRISQQLDQLYSAELHHHKTVFMKLSTTLEAYNPLRVLNRGYSILEKDGEVISSIGSVDVGECYTVRLSDGTVDVVADKVKGEDAYE